MTSARTALALALSCALCAHGCAVQLDAAHERAFDRNTFGWGARLEGRVVSGVPAGVTAGASVLLGGRSGEQVGGVQSVTVSTGYLSRPETSLTGSRPGHRLRMFGWELVGDIGFGAPLDERFDGPGFYLGARAGGFLRLVGEPPHRRTARIVWASLDLVVGASLGVWAPPSSIDARVPAGYSVFTVGLRGTILSDVLAATTTEDRE